MLRQSACFSHQEVCVWLSTLKAFTHIQFFCAQTLQTLPMTVGRQRHGLRWSARSTGAAAMSLAMTMRMMTRLPVLSQNSFCACALPSTLLLRLSYCMAHHMGSVHYHCCRCTDQIQGGYCCAAWSCPLSERCRQQEAWSVYMCTSLTRWGIPTYRPTPRACRYIFERQDFQTEFVPHASDVLDV